MRERKGFTLLEMLIVLTIISILAIIVWGRFGDAYEGTYTESVRSDLRSVAMAQELYHQIHLQYGELADLESYKPTDGVTITITYRSGAGFAATGSHSGLGAAAVCGYYYGDDVPAGSAGPATEPGRATCN